MGSLEVEALHRVHAYPIDADDPFYAHYPAFKLGVKKAARHYAELLAPVALDLIGDRDASGDWVLTSPGLTGAPAGANLLCWALHDLIRDKIPDSKTLTLIDIAHARTHLSEIAPDVLQRHYDYAKLSFEDRVRERERSRHSILLDERFRGKAVIFVNDILVTGAHQLTKDRYFREVGAATVRWLYLIAVDPEIGRSHPELEWEINYSSFDDFFRMLRDEEIEYTCKCLQKLFQQERTGLEAIVRGLSPQRRGRVLAAARREGFQDLDCFREKMELLISYAKG